jgi:hypothetical protein
LRVGGAGRPAGRALSGAGAEPGRRRPRSKRRGLASCGGGLAGMNLA